MPGAHQNLEHAEHATHAAHGSGDGHSGDSNKLFGVSMALIGVLIAFCSLMVGSERNEFTRSMIKQTQAHAKETSASVKLRLAMIELEKQHARVATARDSQGGWSPVKRFIELASDYREERDLAGAWARTYDPLVETHFEAAESYERAQLIAEIGIVLASLAVLLASRTAWLLAVIVSLVSITQLGRTGIHTHHIVKQSTVTVQHAQEAFADLRSAHLGADQDLQAIDWLDPDGKIRAEIAEEAKKHAAAPPTQKTAEKD